MHRITRTAVRFLSFVMLAGVFAPDAAQADEKYWTSGGGETVWNALNANWATTPNGTYNTTFGNDNANFEGVAGTVTVSAPNPPYHLKFTVTGYTLTGGTLTTIGNASDITCDPGISATINSTLHNANATSFIKKGTGTLTLGGNNTFTGLMTINEGTLVASHDNALGTAVNSYSSGVRVPLGAELHLSGGITVGDEIFQDGGKLRSVSGNNIWGGQFDANARITIQADSGSTLTLSRATTHDGTGPWGLYFAGAGDIQVNGQLKMQSQALTKGTNSADTGTATFIGDNTIGGFGNNGIKVNCGTLRVTSPGKLPPRPLHVGGNYVLGGSYGQSFGTPTLAGNGTCLGQVTIYGPSAPSVAGTIAGANGETFELQNGLDLQSGSKSTFDLAGAPSGNGIRVSGGSFSVSATHTITIANGTQSGTYTLFSSDGTPGILQANHVNSMTLDVAGSDPGFTYGPLTLDTTDPGNHKIKVTLTSVMGPTGFLLIVR